MTANASSTLNGSTLSGLMAEWLKRLACHSITRLCAGSVPFWTGDHFFIFAQIHTTNYLKLVENIYFSRSPLLFDFHFRPPFFVVDDFLNAAHRKTCAVELGKNEPNSIRYSLLRGAAKQDFVREE